MFDHYDLVRLLCCCFVYICIYYMLIIHEKKSFCFRFFLKQSQRFTSVLFVLHTVQYCKTNCQLL